MATATLGTAATSTLTAQAFAGNLSTTDLATIANLILNDQINGNPTQPIWPGAWAQTGILYVPNRGILRALPGDYVGVDVTGWPILVSKQAAASASWVHVP